MRTGFALLCMVAFLISCSNIDPYPCPGAAKNSSILRTYCSERADEKAYDVAYFDSAANDTMNLPDSAITYYAFPDISVKLIDGNVLHVLYGYLDMSALGDTLYWDTARGAATTLWMENDTIQYASAWTSIHNAYFEDAVSSTNGINRSGTFIIKWDGNWILGKYYAKSWIEY